jgi:hypothetical protein
MSKKARIEKLKEILRGYEENLPNSIEIKKIKIQLENEKNA